MFEELDDLGNYVADPNLRCPVGTTCDTSCPLDRALSMLSRVSTSGQKVGANMSHGGVPGNVETKSNLNLKSRSASKEWVFVDKPTSPRGGNVSNEETIGTGNAGTKIDGNVENDVIRMESLPFTEYSEIEEDPSQPVPLAAVNPYGDPIKITPIQSRLPSHHEKSVVGGPCLSAKSIGSNGFVLNSESSSEVVWQSSSSMVAIHHPRRLAKPSMYKISPFIIPQFKISVSKLESDVYEAVLKMGESSEHLNLKVVDYGFVVVLLSALSSSLRPGGKVNHFVVNAFCKLLFLRKHPRDSRKHYFFSKVGDYLIENHGRDDEKEKELFETAVRCFKGAHRARPLTFSDYLDNLATVWKQVVNIDYGLHAFHVFFGTVPQQSDNIINNSGVYAIKNLEHFEVHLNMLEKYTEDDISQLLIKLVNDMVFNEYNSAYDGTCKVKEVWQFESGSMI
ncbi:unnamed protein product [Miscanthus lutarioriparius]|uniref:Uncharacterized protein n=1 Tax=Miscanthus lutarioriparius TaxID=422564 RepID=A0A811PI84_9POAL|nr:unnamed protein product [Miscanthus lutarioriparius]